ncbi:hypothetical protein IU11_07420 [Cellulosimicrobium sp. MM]|nr:hypothetical protein IU11_07420 [Cellulosimicrobium sp. MM]
MRATAASQRVHIDAVGTVVRSGACPLGPSTAPTIAAANARTRAAMTTSTAGRTTSRSPVPARRCRGDGPSGASSHSRAAARSRSHRSARVGRDCPGRAPSTRCPSISASCARR